MEQILAEGHVDGNSPINVNEPDGPTALVYSINACQQPAIARVLLRHGADPNASRDDGGCTALMSACAQGDALLITDLLDHGAELETPTDGMTAFHFACMSGNADAVEVIVRAGCDTSKRSQGLTGAAIARASGHSGVLERLELLQSAEQDSSIKAGMRVRLHSLQSESGKALNGKVGEALEYIGESGRWRVKLQGGDIRNFKPCNLLDADDD